MVSRSPLITAALPMPAEGISLLNAVAERLYGTGEYMLDMSAGTSIAIMAPTAGFGARNREPLPELSESDGKLAQVEIADDVLELTLEQAQGVCGAIAQAMTKWFEISGGINYITCRFTSAEDGDEAFDHHLTVQRNDKPTAHELRQIAEQRVALLEAQLIALGATPADS